MDQSPSGAQVDDRALVDACVQGIESAWDELFERHGLFIDAVVARVLDERRRGYFSVEELFELAGRARGSVRDHADTLRKWQGARLRPLLAVMSRQRAEELIAQSAPTVPVVSFLPPSAEVTTELSFVAAIASRVNTALSRLTPHLVAILRLRMRGLALGDMATTLGQPQDSVREDLRKVALRISAVQDSAPAEAWRVLLDCADVSERVMVAVRTEADEDFRKSRSIAEATWRELTRAVLSEPPTQTPGPLSKIATVASFVDGTLRGSERSRAEGHLATCSRCVDTVAMAVMDLRGAESLRPVAEREHKTTLAACCIGSARYAAGRILADRAADEGSEVARWLGRLAQVGMSLQGNKEPRTERSGLQAMSRLPGSDEAPIIAFEALAAGERTTAYRAIDPSGMKRTIGQRLRMLAGAAGSDVPEARRQAEGVLASPSADPGLQRDAELIVALPSDHALPQELLVTQLRDALPDAVRFVTSLSR